MKYTALICLMAFTFSYPMEKKSLEDRVSSYQFLPSDFVKAKETDLSLQFPCDPAIVELIKKNLNRPPGYFEGKYDWLPDHQIRIGFADTIIGAATIRKCAKDLQLNLVSAPDRKLAHIDRAELVVYAELNEEYLFPYRNFVVQKRIPCTNALLSLAQITQLCALIKSTGFKIENKTDILNGLDGIVYLDDTNWSQFSQAKTQEEFANNVSLALRLLRTNSTVEPDALNYLNQQIELTNDN